MSQWAQFLLGCRGHPAQIHEGIVNVLEAVWFIWLCENWRMWLMGSEGLTVSPDILGPISGSASDKWFFINWPECFTVLGFYCQPLHWEIVPEAGDLHAFCDFQPKFILRILLFLCQHDPLAQQGLFNVSSQSNQISSQFSFCKNEWAELF